MYPFGTPYETMRKDLIEKDEKLCAYTTSSGGFRSGRCEYV